MTEIIPGYFVHTPDEKFGPYANIMEADTAAEKLMSEGVQVLGITKEGFEGVVSFEALEYSAESTSGRIARLRKTYERKAKGGKRKVPYWFVSGEICPQCEISKRNWRYGWYDCKACRWCSDCCDCLDESMGPEIPRVYGAEGDTLTRHPKFGINPATKQGRMRTVKEYPHADITKEQHDEIIEALDYNDPNKEIFYVRYGDTIRILTPHAPINPILNGSFLPIGNWASSSKKAISCLYLKRVI